MKLHLPTVTAVLIDCYNYGTAVDSLKRTMALVDFCSVKFLTDIEIEVEGVDVVKIPRITNKEDYSKFCIRELYKYFDSSHVLILQHDSGVWYPEAWDNDFLRYSAIGAAWIYTDGRNNSNGGFSCRTKEFCQQIANDTFIDIYHPEDEVLFRLYRKYLEQKYNAIFPDDETCDRFSFELRTPYCKSFGYHGRFHEKFKSHIVLCRQAALGDLIMLCPVIEYYCEQGYQVVLDTLPQFMEIFHRYKYPIIHLSQMDVRIKPEKNISFDLVYENKPRQLALKSYIEVTGENISLTNAKLYFPIDLNANLFSKFILIHADSTGLAHRDVHGVNWQMIVGYYQKLGFLVFQIGKRMKEEIAPYLNTTNLETLMYVIAGCDLFIGLDSSPLQISVALNKPSVGLFGSVNPAYRYLPTEKLVTLHTSCPSGKDRFCYHEKSGVVGSECVHDKDTPPCTVFSEFEIITAANKLLKIN